MIKNNEFNVADLRREYTRGGLHRRDLTANPFKLFERWLKQACDSGLPDPTAMCIATVDASGQPFQRIVLLKQYDDQGLVFYTNLGSRKALHLAENPRISLLFPWYMLERQVVFLGQAERLSTIDVFNYFTCRPKESQIAAWASKQSSIIPSRKALESKFDELKQKFRQGDIPVPAFWGGFRVRFSSVEFWQGGEHRLHDRFFYQRQADKWTIERLSP